jgi:tartrate-resistant acid phosphatase type 5
MSLTFAQLIADLKPEVFPEGLAENLDIPFDKSVKSALIDLQRWVTCLQANHVSFYPQCSTFFRLGRTAIDAPVGRINKVSTVAGEDGSTPLVYTQVDWDTFNCWSANLALLATNPTNLGLTVLPMGFKYPESSSDSAFGRAVAGIWCVHRSKLWVAPWLQSGESLVIDWDGIQLAWGNADLVPEALDVRRAVKLFVQQDNPQWFENGGDLYAKWREEYQSQRGDLIFECRQQTMVRPSPTCEAEADAVAAANAAALAEPVAETVTQGVAEVYFAVIADYGSSNANELAVSQLLKSHTLNFIATAGDNDNVVGAVPGFDDAVGQYYADYIFPYEGAYGAGASANHFYPAIGNHDYGDPADLSAFSDFFKLPGNGRYYDVVQGAVHMFFLNGSGFEADGMGTASDMANWLRRRIALSTVPWKIVFCHIPPYSSGNFHGDNADLQWLKDTGASLIISGHDHDYERIEVDGVTHIVCGIGGADLRGFNAVPVAGSIVRYFAKHGALFIRADCDQLVGTAESVDGDTIDTFTLTL